MSGWDEWMSPEELAQAMSGTNQFALEWIQAADQDQAELVWAQMTPDFRLAMAQSWLTHNPRAFDDPSAVTLSRDELAHCLAEETPQHELFPHLARVSLREIRNTYGDLEIDQLGLGFRPLLSAYLSGHGSMINGTALS